MKIEVKELKKSQVELTISVPEEKMKEYKKEVIKKFSESKKIDGFRKGHIPEKIILEHFGENVIIAEAMDIAIQKTYLDESIQRNFAL